MSDTTPPLGTRVHRRRPAPHRGGRPPLPPEERRSAMLALYATPPEAEAIRHAAAASDETLSEFMLKAVQERARIVRAELSTVENLTD